MKVLVAGNTKKIAQGTAIEQISAKAQHYIIGGDYEAAIIKHTSKKITPVEIVPKKKKVSPLTPLQIKLVQDLFNGAQFWYVKYDEGYADYSCWKCGDTSVGNSTIISMVHKDVLKCVHMNENERATQIALGTMNPNAVQLVLNPKADVIKKCKNLAGLLNVK